MWHAFIFFLSIQVHLIRAVCKPRGELVLENLALRQQVSALSLGRHKPKFHDADRAFWVALRRSWSGWANRLVIVKPETVVDWQRRRFRRFWTRISKQRGRPGRPRIDAEIRELIGQMVRENHWGTPRIFSELKKLGFTASETTVSRYVQRLRRPNPDPDLVRRWIAFLRNHRGAIASMDPPCQQPR
ncbi:MAG: helix-turn-helix domain-containing protein [Myxococcales bacterium]|nr:MAG: helix-turn-helix domain-containing protein [Myxococcales bacterium]